MQKSNIFYHFFEYYTTYCAFVTYYPFICYIPPLLIFKKSLTSIRKYTIISRITYC